MISCQEVGKNDLMDHIKGKKPNNFQAMSQQQDINGHQYDELCASAFSYVLMTLTVAANGSIKN